MTRLAYTILFAYLFVLALAAIAQAAPPRPDPKPGTRIVGCRSYTVEQHETMYVQTEKADGAIIVESYPVVRTVHVPCHGKRWYGPWRLVLP